MTPWKKCFDCGEPVVPDGPDTYLWWVGMDGWKRLESWVCGSCFDDSIRWCFFEPVPEGDEDLWNPGDDPA